jgi:hypothetical protein
MGEELGQVITVVTCASDLWEPISWAKNLAQASGSIVDHRL